LNENQKQQTKIRRMAKGKVRFLSFLFLINETRTNLELM
jgi:hypothetical protein